MKQILPQTSIELGISSRLAFSARVGGTETHQKYEVKGCEDKSVRFPGFLFNSTCTILFHCEEYSIQLPWVLEKSICQNHCMGGGVKLKDARRRARGTEDEEGDGGTDMHYAAGKEVAESDRAEADAYGRLCMRAGALACLLHRPCSS